jgi:hypothetical protein
MASTRDRTAVVVLQAGIVRGTADIGRRPASTQTASFIGHLAVETGPVVAYPSQPWLAHAQSDLADAAAVRRAVLNLIGVQILVLPIDAVLKLPIRPLTDLHKPERTSLCATWRSRNSFGWHTSEVDNLPSNLKTDMSLPHGEQPKSKRH